MKNTAIAGAGILLTAGLVAMAQPPSEGADFVYAGQDDDEAARLLVKSFRAINPEWDAQKAEGLPAVILRRPDDGVMFRPNFLVEPKMMPRGMDRIVFIAFHPGEPGLADDLEGLKFFNELNSVASGISFSVLGDGKIVAEACLDLRNNLPGRDLQEFIEDVDSSYRFLSEHKDLKDGMRRYFSERPRRDRDA